MSVVAPRADLRFLLPLRAGEKVVVPAGERALAAAATGDGLAVINVMAAPWPLADGAVDHVFLPAPDAATSSPVAFSLRRARRWLVHHRFEPWASYGVREGMHTPTLLVPLEVSAPTRFFFRQRFVPYSAAGRLLAPLASWLATLQQHATLFRDLLLLCRRLPPLA
jgi:hypothetical protein